MESRRDTSDDLQCALDAFRMGATRGTFESDRYRMRFLTWGCGPPILFIHGMADTELAFLMVMHRLARRFACIGYSLPDGTADGSRLAGYSLEDYTADMLALLKHLGCEGVSLVGSSFGSIITLAALATEPGRFTCAVLQNGFAHRPLNRYQRALARAARYWPGWFADWPEIHGLAMRRLNRPLFGSISEEVAKYFLQQSGRTPMAAAAYRALAIDQVELRPQLPRIHTPVMLLTGDQDRLVPRQCWADLEAGLPRVGRAEIAGCGHYPQYTHPREMAEAIARFVGEEAARESASRPLESDP